MAAPMNSAQFKAIVEPILNKPFLSHYNVRKDEYKSVFDEEPAPFKRSYHEEPVLPGFPVAPELPEGTPFTYAQSGTFFIARVVFKVYGLAFALTKETIEDAEHIQIGSNYAKHLARSLKVTKETVCQNILNRSFSGSYVGGDGVSLINTAHPYYQGGTWSNRLSTDANLSPTSVEQLVIQIRNAKDWNGKPISLAPKKLVVPNQLEQQAEVVLKSTLRSGTANNDINALKSIPDLFEDGYARLSLLTSPTAWWIQTDAPRGLINVQRSAMENGMEGDFETRSMRYKAEERYQPFWVDPHCLYGSTGA